MISLKQNMSGIMQKALAFAVLIGSFSNVFAQQAATPSVGEAAGYYSGKVPTMAGLSEEENAQLPRTLYARYFDRGLLDPSPLSEKSQALTDIAYTLAGLASKGGTTQASVTSTEAYDNHQKVFADIWKQVDETQLSRARKFGATNVDGNWNTTGGLFYPFSGPDFLYANTFFPNVNYYVLAGLEPSGEVPNLAKMDAQALGSSLKSLQKSLDDILRWSFFRTLDMEVDFRYNQLKGTIPVIMTFMAKTDHEILDIEHVGLDSLSNLVPVKFEDREAFWQKTIEGVRFTFRKKGTNQPKTLIYFSVNLHDGPMEGQPEIEALVRKMRYPACYLKSASYLMHKDYFSKVRNIILNRCNLVLQDPSGIPVRFFPEDKWDRHFFGNYTGPISLFSNYYQGDLMNIYKTTPNIPPLDFGIGYKFNVGTSSFMLAYSKSAQAWHKQALASLGKNESITPPPAAKTEEKPSAEKVTTEEVAPEKAVESPKEVTPPQKVEKAAPPAKKKMN